MYPLDVLDVEIFLYVYMIKAFLIHISFTFGRRGHPQGVEQIKPSSWLKFYWNLSYNARVQRDWWTVLNFWFQIYGQIRKLFKKIPA